MRPTLQVRGRVWDIDAIVDNGDGTATATVLLPRHGIEYLPPQGGAIRFVAHDGGSTCRVVVGGRNAAATIRYINS
jgi:hypothetical protein